MCAQAADVPVGVMLAFPACEHSSPFCDKCMWQGGFVYSTLRFVPTLTGTCVAQDQEPEALPVDDLLQLCLITKLVFPKIQNQGEHLGKTVSDKG